MSRDLVIEGLGSFEALESKISLSAISVGLNTVQARVDVPPPGPEPDPGPMPPDSPPIVYPPL